MQQEELDLYANQVSITSGTYDILFNFGLQYGPDPKVDRKSVVRVRMSPQHALVMSKVLAKNLTEYQKKAGKINLPPDLCKELGIPMDDWL